MADLRGIYEINKIINDFTAQFDVTAMLHTEFQALCDSRVIGYSLIVDNENNNFFMEDAQRRYPDINADPFLWLLFHEIGHCMTDGQWSDEELEYFWYQKKQLTYIEDDQARNDWYHAIPDEFHATKWAGEFMRKHPNRIAEFWAELQPALQDFYLMNEITEDEEI